MSLTAREHPTPILTAPWHLITRCARPAACAARADAHDASLTVVCARADELESVLRSLAWQSPSLAAYMQAGIQREDECQLLTADDMAELMADTNDCAPKRQKRRSDDTPRSPPAHEHEAAPAAHLSTAHQRTASDGELETCVATRAGDAGSTCGETGGAGFSSSLSSAPSGPLSAGQRHNRDPGLLGQESRTATQTDSEPPGHTLGVVAHRFQELTLQHRVHSASS
jgi:hypothetical protein